MEASGILTAVAGCIAVVVPGLLFSLALFPERRCMAVRAASSVGLGLLLSTWICYVLARYHQLDLGGFLRAMTAAGAFLLVLAYLRKGLRLPRILPGRATGKTDTKPEPGKDVQVQAGDSGQG